MGVVLRKTTRLYGTRSRIKKQEAENRQYWTKESANIHQEMYDLATKSGATTVQLDPIGGSENFQGGSENVHR